MKTVIFTPFEGKPITRLAYQIKQDDDLRYIDKDLWQVNGVRFKAHQEVNFGDWVCQLTAEDTYHVTDKVFRERNVVPTGDS